jgi:hypothetical protein
MEIEHAKRLGLPLRHAEAENQRLLERTERELAGKPKAPAKKRAPVVDNQRLSRQMHDAARGVTRRAAAPIVAPKPPPCKHCGTCRLCLRTKRVMTIIHRRKESAALDSLALRMFVTALQAQAAIGRFKGLSRRDADRAHVVELESICDASVRYLGAWM